MTYSIMFTIMTNNAASYFNLDGRMGIITTVKKRAFAKLSLYKLVEGEHQNEFHFSIAL
jgi:hypothetical protein